MIWQPEFTDKTLSRKPGAVQTDFCRFQIVQTQKLCILVQNGCPTSSERMSFRYDNRVNRQEK
ncbi:hypothetical protein MS8345_B00095 (plasmid) [Escherichia coli]|nr:hypothetical protein MS8345_B00095 [Escherichia coli]